MLKGTTRQATEEPQYIRPGRVLNYRWHPPTREFPNARLELTCENAVARITILAPDLMRVRVRRDGHFPPPFSYAVARSDEGWPMVDCSLHEESEALVIRTSRLLCHVARSELHITFLTPDGTPINDDEAGVGLAANDEGVICRKKMFPDEHFYGLGEKTTPLDKRGLFFQMWNTDPQTYDPGDDPIYSNIPFYLALRQGLGYGLFFDNSARGWFDFGARTPGIVTFAAECGEMRYYFFYGPRLTTILERYAELTGHMIMPPLWALGYHQNRWSYYPDSRVREVARQFRRRRIPCEAIHLDIDYMDGFRCFTWHPRRFPDPAGLIKWLHEEGFRVVTMIDPGIKAERSYHVCRDGLERDAFCKYPDGKPFRGPVWPGQCYFPDFTSPHVREWWGELYREMAELGVDGFWNDMNEPVVFGHVGDTFPDIVQHDWEGQGADHRTAHNVYGMQMARATAEGLMRLRPNERPLVISRSVWAGSQRHNMHWLGDNRSNWESLRNTMPLILNMGLSGMPFTGPDTGGFSGTPDGELLARWTQMSAFLPFFRNHTAKGTGDQEPWAFGERWERIIRAAIELRYHLIPYLYTTFWQAAQHGLPIVRPLFLAFQDDPRTASLEDEFMCGDAFLVAPVTTPNATSRPAYIPGGLWYDFWDNTPLLGPQDTRLHAPPEHIPLLVRAGSAIPAWPVMQHTGERPVEMLILHVYPGDGQSLLYEDDGHTWNFQRGNYRLTRFTCTADRNRLRIERTVSGAFQPPYDCIQVLLHGVEASSISAIADDHHLANVQLDPATRTATLESGEFTTLEVNWTS